MKRELSCIGVTAILTLLLSSTFPPQGQPLSERAREAILNNGPYKVVSSAPIQARGWKVASNYSENAQLTRMLNQLVLDELTPVFTNVITEELPGGIAQDRLVIICRRP